MVRILWRVASQDGLTLTSHVIGVGPTGAEHETALLEFDKVAAPRRQSPGLDYQQDSLCSPSASATQEVCGEFHLCEAAIATVRGRRDPCSRQISPSLFPCNLRISVRARFRTA